MPAPVKTQRETDFLDAIAVTGGPVDVAYKYLKANGKTTQPVSNSRVMSQTIVNGQQWRRFVHVPLLRPLSAVDVCTHLHLMPWTK